MIANFQDGTQVLWFPLQAHDILLNVLRRAVMVGENRAELVANHVPDLSGSDVEGEDGVHEREDEQVYLVLDEPPNTQVGSSLRIGCVSS